MNNHHEGRRYNKIDKIYDKLTYFDKYGGSVLLFFILSLVLAGGISYCYIWINVQSIKENWIKERCKPYIIPFAGVINKPDDGVSIIDYTNQNFQYCMQNVIKGVTGDAVQPLTYIVHILNFLANLIKQSINGVRNMFNKVRSQLQSVTEEIMGRLGNIMVPLQQIIISMRDMMSKIQGVITGALFTLLGGYYALQALMGAIAQFIIIILIAIAAMILVFWLIPFTWGIAASTTAIFLSIAIPLTIVLVFMMKYLHIKPSMSIPTIQCLDEDTKIQLKSGVWREIKKIKVGDILWNKEEKDSNINKDKNNNVVTGIFKVNAKFSQMYNLNNIIVSDSHLVFYQKEWIRVHQHPHAIKIMNYNKSLLYCLNTTNGIIDIQDTLFSDWNEEVVYKKNIFSKNKNIGGFYPNTKLLLENGSNKSIKDIIVGDILEDGITVNGVIELDGTNIDSHYFIHLGMNEKIKVAGLLGYKIENSITINREIISKSNHNQEKKIFHLLTDKKIFQINKVIFNDYNYYLDDITF
jgi:hypothetical protein